MSTNEAASPNKLLIEMQDANQQPSSSAFVVVNPDDPPWGVGLAIAVWVTSVVLLIVMQFAVAVPYVIYKSAATGSTLGLATDPTLIFLSILAILPAHILTLLIVWFLVTKRGRRPFWQTFGWSWPRNFGPWKTVGLAFLLLGVSVLITQALGGKETPLDQVIASSLRSRFATAILAVGTAPLVEELTFRGVLYPAIQRSFGMVWAVVMVSVLFAAVHLFQYFTNFGVVVVISLLSISLTLLRARTGRLLPSFVLHLIFNGVQAVFLAVQPFLGKPPIENKAAAGFIFHNIARLFN